MEANEKSFCAKDMGRPIIPNSYEPRGLCGFFVWMVAWYDVMRKRRFFYKKVRHNEV